MDGEIDPEALSALLDEGDGSPDESLRIVDIRDRRAFDRGHLPDSECIPFPELTSRVAELEGADRIVTVCPHGVASQQAAQLIGTYEGTQDARVESLRGGIEGWQEAVGELIESPAPEGDDGADEGPTSPF
ncbi:MULTISPECIES: rhodanese-like domain-containing protein [Halorubrum]|uniref:Rhodanese n=1 Tax=Halorubrum tropicale TaxID=1765655 RepID=A0A0N0BRK3_9EURY|nr:MULTISPECIES: rhodanese-like domain-containing protein [Halorubrum]KOX96873.1 rhodanese [Halorubrum tropicale]TKX45294.1 rhodanese-like domain-containing protein [Halorubrum sp. ARQ200]TKX51532.1 rhodanese-like domain-containing protein [Halorubrum sp. ASP121]